MMKRENLEVLPWLKNDGERLIASKYEGLIAFVKNYKFRGVRPFLIFERIPIRCAPRFSFCREINARSTKTSSARDRVYIQELTENQ